ncbi:zinc ribbon domain-containing protein [Bacillus sp. MRMR6]|uniref:zinc ribbon domain-containing protein n=1 Tax=Bacillus sp. MRMR6 TaxID=1928617 RepID=UPI0009521775|nr:zinc ribbon domain-containing protein [Bacillus sp. MRMR6]OLS41144.1 hypothetical protein BTR25_04585 [Bacillus sp. MRMR6]
MNFCKKCGNPLAAEAKFCTKCGTPAEVTAVAKQITKDNKSKQPEKEEQQVSVPTSTLNLTKETKDAKPERKTPAAWEKKVPKWAIGVGAAVILAIAGIAGAMTMNNGGEKKETTALVAEPEETADKKPPEMSDEDVSALFPGWQMIKQEVVNIKGSYYTLLAIGNNEVEFEEKVKMAVIDYDSENNWDSVWESEEYYADPIIDIESYVGDFYLLNPKGASAALVVFNVMHSGTAQTYDTHAIQIDEKGTGEVAWTGSGSYIEEHEDYIEVMVHGAVQFAVEKDQVKITEILRSEVGSKDALKIEFTLDSNGYVVPTGDEAIYVKVGQPITFVPADDESKRLFDKGDISIYSNSMEYAPIDTSNANFVAAGNEFTFTSEGEYGFLLENYTGDIDSILPPYTFVVHVGDGKKPEASEKKSATSEITSPFPLGTSLSDLKAHYEEPDFDDYYSGARLVAFGKEGYFIDDFDETVTGYYFSAPTLSVFGATVGMTGEEINSLYSENVEGSFNEVEGEGYVYTYYKNGYKIFFDAEEVDGPTISVIVVKE